MMRINGELAFHAGMFLLAMSLLSSIIVRMSRRLS